MQTYAGFICLFIPSGAEIAGRGHILIVAYLLKPTANAVLPHQEVRKKTSIRFTVIILRYVDQMTLKPFDTTSWPS